MARCAKHQPRCSVVDCGAPAKVDWKDDPRDSDTWFFVECEYCEAVFCETHVDENPEVEPVGPENIMTCISCLGRLPDEAIYGVAARA